MNKKRWIKCVCMLMLGSMLTGCWDNVEVNNRSILLEFAIDKNDDYVYDPSLPLDQQKIYRFTYSIPDFGKLSGTESLAKDAETNIVVESPSVASSIDDLEMRSKDTVTFSHVKAIFLGESLMKDPKLFKQTIDAISRDMLIARNVPLLAVNGEATLTSQVENTEQPILGLYVLDYFNNKERPVSFVKKQLMGNFIREIDETRIATIPIFHVEEIEEEIAQKEASPAKEQNNQEEVEKSENKMMGMGVGQKEDVGATDEKGKDRKMDQINISGAALIKDYELVGYVSKEDVRSQLFVEGKIKNSPVMATYRGGPVTYTIKEEDTSISFEDTPEGPVCLIEIQTKGNISEYLDESGEEMINATNTDEIKQQIANQVVEQVKVGIKKAKEMNIDFVGLGLAMYRREPKMWNRYAAGWEAGIFVDMPIEIGVNVDIQSAGIQE